MDFPDPDMPVQIHGYVSLILISYFCQYQNLPRYVRRSSQSKLFSAPLVAFDIPSITIKEPKFLLSS